MAYYKVVRKTPSGLLKSAWMFESGVAVEYEVGKWVRPLIKGAPLVVFDSLRAARIWFDTVVVHNGLIYECAVQASRIQPTFFDRTNMFISVNFVEDFWKAVRTKSESRCDYVPPGSVFCNRVKLVNEV